MLGDFPIRQSLAFRYNGFRTIGQSDIHAISEIKVITPYPGNEHAGVEALNRYEILDTDPEAPCDDRAQLAAQIGQVPSPLIRLIDPPPQRFKANRGMGLCHISLKGVLCGHAILQRDSLEVPDALGDHRFADWLLGIGHDPGPPQAAADLSASRAAPHPAPDPIKSPQASPLRILLVEDMEDNRMLVSVFLKGLPYRLDLAEHGAAGVERFQSGHYHLVLMDIQMPIMDGYEAVRIIRLWEETQQRGATPIIALTGNSREEDIQKTRAAGFTAHVTKPLKKHTLLEAIQRYAINSSLEESAS